MSDVRQATQGGRTAARDREGGNGTERGEVSWPAKQKTGRMTRPRAISVHGQATRPSCLQRTQSLCPHQRTALPAPSFPPQCRHPETSSSASTMCTASKRLSYWNALTETQRGSTLSLDISMCRSKGAGGRTATASKHTRKPHTRTDTRHTQPFTRRRMEPCTSRRSAKQPGRHEIHSTNAVSHQRR